MNNKQSKFRVWDEKYRCWGDEPILCYPNQEIKKQGRIIQWYTGLTDSNDKEICEGDILKTPGVNDNVIGQVIYEVGQGAYIFQWKRNGPNQNYMNLNCDVAFESVIIGNIFEHKHLLEK